eukprot:360650-Chlamydomonas_euryale.AAC.5
MRTEYVWGLCRRHSIYPPPQSAPKSHGPPATSSKLFYAAEATQRRKVGLGAGAPADLGHCVDLRGVCQLKALCARAHARGMRSSDVRLPLHTVPRAR